VSFSLENILNCNGLEYQRQFTTSDLSLRVTYNTFSKFARCYGLGMSILLLVSELQRGEFSTRMISTRTTNANITTRTQDNNSVTTRTQDNANVTVYKSKNHDKSRTSNQR
jgi:hypothetical protein